MKAWYWVRYLFSFSFLNVHFWYRLLRRELSLTKRAAWFYSDLSKFNTLSARSEYFPITNISPQLTDKNEFAGSLRNHYFHQDLYVAQKLFENNPKRHVDIGSRVDGFVGHVASFREIQVFDIIPEDAKIKNVDFVSMDFMDPNMDLEGYTDSLSSLHVIEHFGLGRYGDPLDFDGHIKGLQMMQKMLKVGGIFYFATPIGPQRIEFNAHRVFDVKYLLAFFKGQFDIIEFSYINDEGHLLTNVELLPEEVKNNFGCHYGCGIFIMKKRV